MSKKSIDSLLIVIFGHLQKNKNSYYEQSAKRRTNKY